MIKHQPNKFVCGHVSNPSLFMVHGHMHIKEKGCKMNYHIRDSKLKQVTANNPGAHLV